MPVHAEALTAGLASTPLVGLCILSIDPSTRTDDALYGFVPTGDPC
jgi:hypothetical protein